MRFRVLVVTKAQEPLIESALAYKERRLSKIPFEEAKLPARVQLDTSLPAVPVGTGMAGPMASFDANVSERFAVRGFVEAESMEEIPAEADGQPLFADPEIQPFQGTGCGGVPIGDAKLVASKLNVATLAAKGLDGSGVAVAIMDTGVNLAHLSARIGKPVLLDAANSWTPAGMSIAPGKHPVGHGTMCAYDALIAAPKATVLDFPILSATSPGGSVMGGTLSTALLAFAQLIAGWGVAFAPGGLGTKYRALVVNNSWGIYHPSWDFPAGHPGRYCDNPRHPFNLITATLASSGADILFAAGNCGSHCPDGRCQGRTTEAIMGASAHPDVLTLAGCDTSNHWVGYSSQGPSIAGMHLQKPDLSAYTHFSGSEAFGAGSPDSGTSTACPVAAGCVAALRSKLKPSHTPPANLFAQLRSTARAVGGHAGWNGDYGYGIIDPVAAANSLGL